MTLIRIYMQDMTSYKTFHKIADKHFSSYTMYQVRGRFEGINEDSTVLEYITEDEKQGDNAAQAFSNEFCTVFGQECTLITKASCEARFSQ